MNKEIEKYLELANSVLERGKFANKKQKANAEGDNNDESILSYNSAIKSSFSAIPVNLRFYGLVPTIAMFGRDNKAGDKASKFRNQALQLVAEVLFKAGKTQLDDLSKLLEYNQTLHSSELERKILSQEMQYAAAALKIVIRTFNIEKTKL